MDSKEEEDTVTEILTEIDVDEDDATLQCATYDGWANAPPAWYIYDVALMANNENTNLRQLNSFWTLAIEINISKTLIKLSSIQVFLDMWNIMQLKSNA